MRTRPARSEALVQALYARHGAALLRYVQRLLGGDRAMAEDIVQETLLRAWRHADELTIEGARPWLFTVARHLVVDTRRARIAPPIDVVDTALEDEAATHELDTALDACLVADALAALSQQHREVIVEAFFLGRTVSDIADAHGLPAGTVRSRMFYGMRALRMALHERGVQTP